MVMVDGGMHTALVPHEMAASLLLDIINTKSHLPEKL